MKAPSRLHFRPAEGTLLDLACLNAIADEDERHLQLFAELAGCQGHGLVLEGLRVTASGQSLRVMPGQALVVDASGRMTVAALLESLELPIELPGASLLVARALEERVSHEQTGLRSSSKQVSLQLAVVRWEDLEVGSMVPVAAIDLEAGLIDHDVCRWLQPQDPEVRDLARRLRLMVTSRLQQTGPKGQLEYQGQVQEHLSPRDHVFLSALQAVTVELIRGPASSVARIRLVNELALQVRTLYRGHPRLRDYVREVALLGYEDHEHARQLQAERGAARFQRYLRSLRLEEDVDTEGIV